MQALFKEFSSFHSFCSSIFVFQLSVCTDRGRGLLSTKWTEGGRRVENWHKFAGILSIIASLIWLMNNTKNAHVSFYLSLSTSYSRKINSYLKLEVSTWLHLPETACEFSKELHALNPLGFHPSIRVTENV